MRTARASDTNNHVISGSSQIEVTLPDQSRYKARILVRLLNNDLALIKIDLKKKLRYSIWAIPTGCR